MGKDVYTPLYVKKKLQAERPIRLLGWVAGLLFFCGYFLMGSDVMLDISVMPSLTPLFLYCGALVAILIRWMLATKAMSDG